VFSSSFWAVSIMWAGLATPVKFAMPGCWHLLVSENTHCTK